MFYLDFFEFSQTYPNPTDEPIPICNILYDYVSKCPDATHTTEQSGADCYTLKSKNNTDLLLEVRNDDASVHGGGAYGYNNRIDLSCNNATDLDAFIELLKKF